MRVALPPSGPYSLTEGAPTLPAARTGSERVLMLPNGWRRLLFFPARAAAGSLEAMERLACEVRLGIKSIPRSVRRVIVHSQVDLPLLAELDREFLWRAFRLPIFEHVRGCEGELLAFECEAHSGLHVNLKCARLGALSPGAETFLVSPAGVPYPPLRMSTGLTARYVPGLCACGHESPRLMFTPTAP